MAPQLVHSCLLMAEHKKTALMDLNHLPKIPHEKESSFPVSCLNLEEMVRRISSIPQRLALLSYELYKKFKLDSNRKTSRNTGSDDQKLFSILAENRPIMIVTPT